MERDHRLRGEFKIHKRPSMASKRGLEGPPISGSITDYLNGLWNLFVITSKITVHTMSSSSARGDGRVNRPTA